jgi:hypothetical protein
MLAYIENFPTFTAYCFVVRGMEALGASAYATASYVFVVDIFPDNIGSVLVSKLVISVCWFNVMCNVHGKVRYFITYACVRLPVITAGFTTVFEAAPFCCHTFLSAAILMIFPFTYEQEHKIGITLDHRGTNETMRYGFETDGVSVKIGLDFMNCYSSTSIVKTCLTMHKEEN